VSEKRPFDISLSDWFWSVIDRIRADPDTLPAIVERMTKKQMARFYQEYRDATEELHGHESFEDLGLSDEEMSESAAWVVAQGRDHYRAVWSDPSRTVPRGVPRPAAAPPPEAATEPAGRLPAWPARAQLARPVWPGGQGRWPRPGRRPSARQRISDPVSRTLL